MLTELEPRLTDPAGSRRGRDPHPGRNWYPTLLLVRYSALIPAVVGLLTIAILGLQVVIYLRQSKIMAAQVRISQKANNLTRATQRPFVYLDRLDVAFYRALGGNQKYGLVSPVWGNSGSTAATRVRQVTGCLPSKKVIVDPFEMMNLKFGPGGQTLYGARTKNNLGESCYISGSMIDLVNERRSHAYVCGEVEYADIVGSGIHHITEFCAEMMHLDSQDATKNSGFSVGEHNCADADCPR